MEEKSDAMVVNYHNLCVHADLIKIKKNIPTIFGRNFNLFHLNGSLYPAYHFTCDQC